MGESAIASIGGTHDIYHKYHQLSPGVFLISISRAIPGPGKLSSGAATPHPTLSYPDQSSLNQNVIFHQKSFILEQRQQFHRNVRDLSAKDGLEREVV